jgi:hypothetical protein
METMRDSWTDGRLDNLSDRMDQGFEVARVERRELRADMDRHFETARVERRELRTDMDRGFELARAERQELRAEMNTRFDALQRTLILMAGGVVASLIGLIATQL